MCVLLPLGKSLLKLRNVCQADKKQIQNLWYGTMTRIEQEQEKSININLRNLIQGDQHGQIKFT